MMWFVIVLNIVVAGAAATPLTSPCPVNWRGVPAGKAFTELGGRLGVEYVVDDSVEPKQLEKDIRLTASHLSGRQAFRWLARLTGLEALEVDGAFVLTSPQGGGTFQVTGGPAGLSNPVADDRAGWEAVRGKRAAVSWQGTPLSRIGNDLSKAFGVDAIFHETILAEPVLITLERSDVTLESVCQEVANQALATVEYLDGAIWIHPPSPSGAPPASRPAVASDRVPSTAPADGRLETAVHVDRSIQGWTELSKHLSEVSGVSCSVDVPAGAAYPVMEAKGRLVDVLEAIRLLGWARWTYESSAAVSGGASLRIHVGTGH